MDINTGAIKAMLSRVHGRLRKYPLQSVVAILVVAIGVGLSVATTSIVDGVLLKGLPFHRADQIVRIEIAHELRSHVGMPLRAHEFEHILHNQRSFSGFAGFSSANVIVSGDSSFAERYEAARVAGDLFQLLGVQPLLGRLPSSGRDGRIEPNVALISHRFWRNRFLGDPAAVGSQLRVDGTSRTIVGIMPERFGFPVSTDLWLPATFDESGASTPGVSAMVGVGRLRNGTDISQAQAELDNLSRQLERDRPATNEGLSAKVNPYVSRVVGEQLIGLAVVMLLAAFAMLLIASLNVSGLLLARAADGAKEVAVRCALGARRWHIILNELADSFLVFSIGGVLAIGVAWLGIAKFNRVLQAESGVPFWIDIRIDANAMVVSLVLVLLCSLLAGILPGLYASRPQLTRVLQDTARSAPGLGTSRFQRALVVLEIMLSCALLVPTGLLVKSVTQLGDAADLFDGQSILTARVGPPRGRELTTDTTARFFEALQRRLQAEPAIEHVAYTTAVPGVDGTRASFTIEGRSSMDTGRSVTARAAVSPEFFAVFGTRIERGRGFLAADDGESTPIAIVNESFAARHLGERDAVGTRIRIAGPGGELEERVIVGVAPDILMNARRPRTGIMSEDASGVYVPLAQDSADVLAIVAKTRGSAASVAPVLERHVASLDSDVLYYRAETLSDGLARVNMFYFVLSGVFTVFGVVGLLMALLGLYGILAFSVASRAHEIGVRRAMGATNRDIVALIVAQAARFLMVGVLAGLGLGLITASSLRVVLFQVSTLDANVFIGVALSLFAAGLVACLVPIKGALRVDPIVALRG